MGEYLEMKEKHIMIQMIKAITGITVILGQQYNKNAHLMSDGTIPLATQEDLDLIWYIYYRTINHYIQRYSFSHE